MDRIIDKLALFLEFTNLRHKILAGNIANAETPNYKPFDLVFKKVFEEKKDLIKLCTTHKKHIKGSPLLPGSPKLIITPPLTAGLDGNWVDIEYQMSQLAQNTIEYEIAARLIAKKFEEYRFAISEGR